MSEHKLEAENTALKERVALTPDSIFRSIEDEVRVLREENAALRNVIEELQSYHGKHDDCWPCRAFARYDALVER